MREAEDSLSNAGDPLFRRAIRFARLPASLKTEHCRRRRFARFAVLDSSRSSLIRLSDWNHRSAKIDRALLSSPNHPRFSRYNFGTSERDKSWLAGP